METLKYISLDPGKDQAELVVQLSGGGAAATIKSGASAAEVVHCLRQLANLLERGYAERAASVSAIGEGVKSQGHIPPAQESINETGRTSKGGRRK